MKFLKRLDEQIVHRHPDGAAPIGISAEEPGVGFSGLVVHGHGCAIDVKFVWVFV